MERIRLICSDPRVNDCSSDEEEEITIPENTVSQIDETPLQVESPERPPRLIRNPKNPYPGVYLRSSGRWASEISSHILRTRLHLGTFDSPEAAYEAYCAKKLEFNEMAASEKIKLKGPQEACSTKKLKLKEEVIPEKNKKSPYQGVQVGRRGNWRSEFRFRGKRFNLGTFKTAEAAYEAYCTKKQELEEKADPDTKKKAASDEDIDPDEAASNEPKSTTKLELNKKVVLEKNKKSPYKGVYFDRGRWRSEIRFKGKRYYVGKFRSAEVAYKAYCSKKQEFEENEGWTGKKVKSGNLGDFRVWDPRAQVRVGTSGSGEGAWGDKSGSSHTAEKVGGSDFVNTSKMYACSSSFSGQDPQLHEKPMFGEKEASKEEEKPSDLGSGSGSGSIPREMDSLIVDEDGFLVGEFSKIDDLTICDMDG